MVDVVAVAAVVVVGMESLVGLIVDKDCLDVELVDFVVVVDSVDNLHLAIETLTDGYRKVLVSGIDLVLEEHFGLD